MRRVLAGISGVLMALAIAAPADAQVGASFVLRSGERLSGDLVDMGAAGLEARINGQTRRWPLSQVAVIDFVNTSTFPRGEMDQSGGEHLLVLRSGQLIKGRLVDVAGTSPKKITFAASGSSHDYTSNDIARIYIARPGSASAGGTGSGTTTDGLAPASGRVRVPAAAGWVNTGVMVSEGQQIMFTSNGEVRLSTAGDDVAGPAGSKKGRYATAAPIPTALAGALVGRIGNGAPFAIGNQVSITAPGTGVLWLAVNDDGLGDNAGEFGVEISVMGRRRR